MFRSLPLEELQLGWQPGAADRLPQTIAGRIGRFTKEPPRTHYGREGVLSASTPRLRLSPCRPYGSETRVAIARTSIRIIRRQVVQGIGVCVRSGLITAWE